MKSNVSKRLKTQFKDIYTEEIQKLVFFSGKKMFSKMEIILKNKAKCKWLYCKIHLIYWMILIWVRMCVHVSLLCLKFAVAIERLLDICDKAYRVDITKKLKQDIVMDSFILLWSLENIRFWRIMSIKRDWCKENMEYKARPNWQKIQEV